MLRVIEYVAKSLKVAQGHSKRHVQGMCKTLLLFHCNYVSIIWYRFGDIQRRIMVYGLGVIEGNWRWQHLIKTAYEFLLAFHSNCGPILYYFRDKSRY